MSKLTFDNTPDAISDAVTAWLSERWTDARMQAVGASPDEMRLWLTEVRDAGLATPSWPQDWFGLGLSPKKAAIIEKAFRNVKAPGWGRDRFHLGAITVFKLGSDELKRAMLPDLLSGPICCLLYSEPSAGSDLAGIRTRADRDGDDYIVTGQKVWTSNAAEADYGMLLARTDWDAPKHKGISFFLFPMKQDGVDVRPINQITGESEFNEVFITEARVPAANLIGEAGQGWKSFQTAIAYERLIMAQGGTERRGRQNSPKKPLLIELAARHNKEADPVLRQKIATAIAYRQLNSLNNKRAKQEIMQKGSSPLMSLGKLAMSRIQHGEARIAADILGPRALLDGANAPDAANANFDAAKAYMNSIGGGTDQIQRNIIAERVLGLPKDDGVDKNVPFRDVKSTG
jgi:alkylation response protein AidB-like acyl-CoA dehydrogenase